MADLLTRITEILSWSSLGPATFADEIGVARAVMSHILSERNKASLEVVQKILTRYTEVSSSWLLTGEGEMLKVIGNEMSPKIIVEAPAMPKEKKERVEQNEEKVPKEIQSISLKSKEENKSNRRLMKIVFFYSDGKFESFEP